jgi:DNA-binding NarL/FixJ family response regulator
MSLRGELFVGLHPRRRQVLTLVAAGGGNKGIARQLGVSTATVNHHMRAILEQLDAASRAQAVAVAIRAGLIE